MFFVLLKLLKSSETFYLMKHSGLLFDDSRYIPILVQKNIQRLISVHCTFVHPYFIHVFCPVWYTRTMSCLGAYAFVQRGYRCTYSVLVHKSLTNFIVQKYLFATRWHAQRFAVGASAHLVHVYPFSEIRCMHTFSLILCHILLKLSRMNVAKMVPLSFCSHSMGVWLGINLITSSRLTF